MTAATSVEYATPANWQDFERLSRALLSSVFKLSFQRWGRSGQRQDGVDIWATSRDGRIIAVQCKGRSQNFGNPLSITDLNAAVLATESFPHAITELIILTTSADDNELQSRATTLTLERTRQHKSTVSVWGWNTISEHIGMHENVQKAFFGHWFGRINFRQRLILVCTVISLVTIGAGGLFLFHEERKDLSQSQAVTVRELQKFTQLIDGLHSIYGGCEQALTKDMFVFTPTLKKSCLNPIETQLTAIDKQLEASTPYLDTRAIEEIASLSKIMSEDFRQVAIANQMTGFFEENMIRSLRRMCLGKKVPPPEQAERDNLRTSQHDAANAQLEFYFLLRDFIRPSLTPMKSRLLVITRMEIGEEVPPSLAESANSLPKLLLERRNYKFEPQQQPLTLSVIKVQSSRSIRIGGGNPMDFVEKARESEVFNRAMIESLKGKTKDVEALIACGVLKPAARDLEAE